MNKLEIDLKIYPTKSKLFSFLKTQIEGLFGANYDALIDALTFYYHPLQISLINISFYEEKNNLLETLEIVHKENAWINYNIK